MTLYQYHQIQKVSIVLNRQSEWSSSWEVNNHLGSRSTAAALQHWTNSTPTPPASSSHTRVTQTSLYATSAFLLYIVSFQKIHCPHSKGRTIKFFKHGFSSRNIYIFFSSSKRKKRPGHLQTPLLMRGREVRSPWLSRGSFVTARADVKSTGCKLSKENTLK